MSSELQQALDDYESGKYQSAEMRFKDLLRQYPKEPDIHHFLALASLRQQNYSDALQHVDNAIRHDPHVDFYYQTKGDIQSAAGLHGLSLQSYFKALMINGDNKEVVKRVLNSYVSSRDMDATVLILRAMGMRRYCEEHGIKIDETYAEKLHPEKNGEEFTGLDGYAEPVKPYVVQLHNVHIIGHSGYVVTDDSVVLDDDFSDPKRSRYNLATNIRHNTIVAHTESDGQGEDGLVMAVVPEKMSIIEGAIVLGGKGGGNYFHWIFEILPKLALLEEMNEFKELPIMVESSLPKQHYDALVAMVGTDRPIIPMNEASHFYVKNAVVPSRLSKIVFDYKVGQRMEKSDFYFSPDAVRYLRRKLAVDDVVRNGKKIYLPRRNARERRILNEDEVAEVFRRHGFEEVLPGELTFEEQLSLFAGCAAVAGPSGAALTNLVFVPNDCRFMLLAQEEAGVDVFYSGLARTVGVQSVSVVSGEVDWSAMKDGDYGYHADITIDVERLESEIYRVGL